MAGKREGGRPDHFVLVDKQNKDTHLMEALHSLCKLLTFELMQTGSVINY